MAEAGSGDDGMSCIRGIYGLFSTDCSFALTCFESISPLNVLLQDLACGYQLRSNHCDSYIHLTQMRGPRECCLASFRHFVRSQILVTLEIKQIKRLFIWEMNGC